MGSVEEIYAVFLIALNLFVIVPLLITSSIILYQNQKSLFFRKRGIAFLIAHLIFSFLIHGIFNPVGLMESWLDHHLENADEKLFHFLETVDPARRFLQNCSAMAIFLNIMFRLFYQFIQVQRCKHTLILIRLPEMKPLANIDDEYSQLESDINVSPDASVDNINQFGKLNFILDNYHIFGNPAKICAIELSIWLLLSIAFLFTTFDIVIKNEAFRFAMRMCVYLVAISFILGSVIYLTNKQHVLKFDDHWGIRKEFKYYAWVLFCVAFFGIISTCVQIAVGFAETALPRVSLVFLMIVTFGSFTYLSFIWVQQLHKQQQQEQTLQQDLQSDSIDTEINLQSFFIITSKFYHDVDYNRMIIQEFKQFAQFVVHELSSENLLFMINIIQFKQFLIKNNYTHQTFWKQHHFNYDLKDFIHPTKSIQQLVTHYQKYIEKFEDKIVLQVDQIQLNLDNDHCNNKHVHELNLLVPFLKTIFDKFIAQNKAPFEINISYKLRDRATKHLAAIINCDTNNLDTNLDTLVLSNDMLLNDILPDLITICAYCMSVIKFSWHRYTAKK